MESIEKRVSDVELAMSKSKTLAADFSNLNESDYKYVKKYFGKNKRYEIFEEKIDANTKLYNVAVHQINKLDLTQ